MNTETVIMNTETVIPPVITDEAQEQVSVRSVALLDDVNLKKWCVEAAIKMKDGANMQTIISLWNFMQSDSSQCMSRAELREWILNKGETVRDCSSKSLAVLVMAMEKDGLL